MSSAAWARQSRSNIFGREGPRNPPSSAIHLSPPPPSNMAEQRRPSGQSLVLDLEGLDLGGPTADLAHSNTRPAKVAHHRAHPSSISSFSDVERPSGPTVVSQTRSDSREADSFATHLREECLDSQEIYSSETMLKADATANDAISPHSHHASGPHAWQVETSFRPQEPTSNASPHLKAQPDISHQVLGGFASLGLSHLPGSSTQLPALNTRESLAPALTSETVPTRWKSLHSQSCDPMDVLDILSIEEMGQLAINMGSRDDWDGLLLSSSDAVPSNSSSESTIVSEGAAVASWMTARSVKGKRKWICTPAVSRDAAARTIVVTDRGLTTGSNTDTRPHAAFSGLASFELRFLRDQDASQTIILASARALRPHFSHLTHGPGRRRRAESLTRSQLPSPRRNPSERPNSSRDEPVLRRTRSRPAIKIGSLDRREETARPERFLIDSLAEAGLLMGASIPSTPVSPCAAPQSLGVNASDLHSVAKTDSQPTSSTLDSSSSGSNCANNQIEHTFPGEVIYPFQDFNFGNGPTDPTSRSLEPSPKSPGCALGPAHHGGVVSADSPLSTRPFLVQTVSDQPLPRELDDSTRVGVSEISDLPATKPTRGMEGGPSSPSRVRKEGSKLTGWLKKRITGNVATGGTSHAPGNIRRADANSRAQRLATDKPLPILSPMSSDVLEYSSDVTHDHPNLAALAGPTMVPPSRSHGTVCGPLSPQGRDWTLKGSLAVQDPMFRRASVSDDQLATMQGQEARKAALGASVARRLSKEVNGARAPRHSVAVIHPSKEVRGRGVGQAWPSVNEKTSLQPGPDGAGENGSGHAVGLEGIPSLTSRPGSSATTTSSNEDPLGLNDASPEALMMVLPLPFRRRGAGAGTSPSLYLRLAFVPFAPRSNLSLQISARSLAKEAASNPLKSAATLTKHHSGPGPAGHWYQRFGRSFAESSSSGPLSMSKQETIDRLVSASKGPEPLLFGAGPARRGEGKGNAASVMLNRRTSYVQAFRVTGQVVDASPGDTTNGAVPGLPPAGSFPVVLAVCMEEQSLEFMPEGWAALYLQGGPSDAKDDAMFGVADAIVAACAAIMDL